MTETPEQVTAERDVLRAAMPKWRRDRGGELFLGAVGFIRPPLGNWTQWYWFVEHPIADGFVSTESDARRAAEAAMGLPVCEVVNG